MGSRPAVVQSTAINVCTIQQYDIIAEMASWRPAVVVGQPREPIYLPAHLPPPLLLHTAVYHVDKYGVIMTAVQYIVHIHTHTRARERRKGRKERRQASHLRHEMDGQAQADGVQAADGFVLEPTAVC